MRGDRCRAIRALASATFVAAVGCALERGAAGALCAARTAPQQVTPSARSASPAPAPGASAQPAPPKVADSLLRGAPVPPNSSNVLAGSFAWERDGFVEPVACAATGDGRFIVVDGCGVVRAMSAASGETLWSADRGGGGAFVRPASAACYGDGAVLVTDPARGLVAVLSAVDGSDLGVWPAEPELRRAWDAASVIPGAIASGPGPAEVPRVVVADANAPGRIVICDGAAIRTLNLPFVPAGIALMPDGSCAASDRDGHRIMRWGPNVSADLSDQPAAAAWGGRGPYPGLLNSPRGLCAAGPWLLIADEHNHRIVRCDAQGAGKLAYGQHAVRPRAGGGKVHYPVAVSHDAESGLALICEPFERRVQAYRVNLDPEPGEVRVVLPSLEGVQSHFGGGVDADGMRLAMEDPESSSVVIFDLSLDAPAHVSTLGMAGTKPHEFVRVVAIAMSGGGSLLCIADDGARRVSLWSMGPREAELRFNPFAGRLVSTRSYESLGISSREGVADAVAARDGFALLVSADARGTAAPRAITTDHLLATHADLRLAPPGEGRWLPRAIALDEGTGRMAWIAGRAGVPAGAPLRWALVGEAVRELDAQDPVDLCLAADGRALVVDRLGDRVIDIPPEAPGADGAPPPTDAPRVSSWGGRGAADGRLWLPLGIVRLGDVAYVVDGGNHRGQAFRTDGTWVATFGLGRSYTRPRSEAEVLGLPGARAGAAPGARAAEAPDSSGIAQRAPAAAAADGASGSRSGSRDAPGSDGGGRKVPESVTARLWWSGNTGGDAVTAPVRSNGGSFWIRARLAADAPLEHASTPPLRRPFTLSIEAYADEACSVPYEADGAIIDSWMPHHRHGMNVAPRVMTEGPGRWRAEGMLMHMSGLWEVDVDLTRQGRSERAQWNVEMP